VDEVSGLLKGALARVVADDLRTFLQARGRASEGARQGPSLIRLYEGVAELQWPSKPLLEAPRDDRAAGAGSSSVGDHAN
jgi:hypothetical protein